MIKKEINKKSGTPGIFTNILGQGNKDQRGSTLFQPKDGVKDGSYYGGGDDDEGNSFNDSFYGEGGEPKEKTTLLQRKPSRFSFLKYLSWIEYIVIAVEIVLIVYTILVLINMAPIF
jgi:hypothetical protein